MERSEFVNALAKRDPTAWRNFVEEYGRIAEAVAARLGFQEADRDDLFQEICLTAMRTIGTLQDPKRLASWVYTIAYRIGIDRLRGRRRELSLAEGDGLLGGPATNGVQEDALQVLVRLERVAALWDVLAGLDDRCRRLLTALYLSEPRMSYEATAQQEDMPIGSIGPTRARCLEKAARDLKKLSSRHRDPSTGRSRATGAAQERRM